MANPVDALRQMSISPSEETSFNKWLQLQDAVAFLKDDLCNDHFVLYANLPNVYIHALLVPSEDVTPPNVDDLMAWNCTAYSGWSIGVSYDPTTIAISPPLEGTGSETLDTKGNSWSSPANLKDGSEKSTIARFSKGFCIFLTFTTLERRMLIVASIVTGMSKRWFA